MPQTFSNLGKCRPVVPGCAMAHPDFGRSVNPISTRGDRLCPPNYYWHTRYFRPSDGPVPLSLLTNVPSCVFLVLIFTLWKMTFHIKQIKRAYDNCRVYSIQTCQHKLRNYEMTTEIRINRFLWPIASKCMYVSIKVGD